MLRHAVWTAEKPGSVGGKNARNGRNFATLAWKPKKNVLPFSPKQCSLPFSLEAPLAVRFHQHC